MIDRGRADVYAAEIAAFEGTSYESLTTLDDLRSLAHDVIGSHWWPRGPIAVVAARRDAHSSVTSQRAGDAPVVRLAAPQMTPATLIHELAHVLAGVGRGHDRGFRRAHVDLAGYAFGETAAGWLLDAYAAIGLDAGDRSWPAPPLRAGSGGPVAL